MSVAGLSYLNNHFYHVKRGALRRSFCFGLTRAQFDQIVCQACWYCGASPEVRAVRRRRVDRVTIEAFHGIDRIDPTIGYTPSNCVPCCKVCNKMKGILTLDEFLKTVRAIARHRPSD